MSYESYGNPTMYDGRYYDSLTEARWAAYFELIGMPAISEPETFEFPSRIIYTPDFYLPNQDTYVEVKNNNADWLACYKARLLAQTVRRTVIIADGSPSNLSLYFLSPDSDRSAPYNQSYPANGFADAILLKRHLLKPDGSAVSEDARKILETAQLATDAPIIGNDPTALRVAKDRKANLFANRRRFA